MQIHELNSFVGTPSATDYLAIDDGNETKKVPATSLGVSTQMTQAEAEAGTVTDSRVITPKVLNNFVSDYVRDLFYPVGSYYETSDTSFDPNTAWGGTWVKEIAGQVHVSAGTGYSVSGANTNTSDGGEKTHTLTIDEMPEHNHGVGLNSGGSSYGSGLSFTTNDTYRTYQDVAGEMILKKGNGQAHNIMQPYIVVNRWHRTA